jgi:hypothetical protein
MADVLFTDQALQDQYRSLMRQNTEGHLDESTWDRLTAKEVPADERDRHFDHIVTCEHCSTIWRGVLALRTEAETQGLIAPEVPARSSWMRSPIAALAIAATLVIVVGGVYLARLPADDPTLLRGSAAPAVEGLMMALNAEGVPNLAWAPLPTATGYRVEVFSDDGRPVWTREVVTPPVPWPAEIPSSPGTYRWRVEAMIGPNVVARSRVSTLEIGR